jgi:protocatechuate 3,4-dioxygenase alpha subunit
MSETGVGDIGLAHEKPQGLTPFQTVGPFFSFALTPGPHSSFRELAGNDLVTDGTAGEVILVSGRITDGDGAPVPDAVVEIWQADGAGRYSPFADRANTAFGGFGRADTSDGGSFSFRTVKPGRVPAPSGGLQAPHINVSIQARGIIRRMFTRIYFADEPANADDPILALVPTGRRQTLIARKEGGPSGPPSYVFDVRLQGANETVFFEA